MFASFEKFCVSVIMARNHGNDYSTSLLIIHNPLKYGFDSKQ